MNRAMMEKLFRFRVADIDGEGVPFFIRKLSPAKYLEIFGTVFPELTTSEVAAANMNEYPRDVARGLRLLEKTVVACFHDAVPVDGVEKPDVETADHWTPGPPSFSEEGSTDVLGSSALSAMGNAALSFSGLNEEVSQTAKRFPEKTASSGSPGDDRE